jgi:hypothetical protein
MSFSHLVKLALAPLILAAFEGGALAQRPSQPGSRPGRPGRPGRFYGGVNYGAAPGVFTVAAVNTRDSLLQLRDEDSRTAEVYVSPRLFDVATLKVGDQVVVDFFVQGDNDDRLEAASIERL